MNFETVIVGSSSDEESVLSQEIDDSIDDKWDKIERRYNENFHVHEFWLHEEWKKVYENNPIFFAQDVAEIYERYECERVTAIRLRAIVIDENTTDVREKVVIRLEANLYQDADDLRDMIYDLVTSNMAPMWIRIEDFETSDTAFGKFVWYDLSFFDLCIQKTPRSVLHATMIVGDGEIHPGVWVKRIFSTNHNIEYGPKDCVIMCMNEATGKMLKPREVKKDIWPHAESPELLDIHRKKHLSALSKIYDTKIILYLVDECIKLKVGKQHNSVKLVKVGKVIGLLDRFEQKIEEEEDTVVQSEGYFDLETVGEVQHVYAYCIKSAYGSFCVADSDLYNVENSLKTDVFDILKKIPEKKNVIMYSWNGSRFDSYIMLRILNADSRFKLYNMIINSANELLTFNVRLGDNTGSLVFRDPCKLFPNTLEKAADIFELEITKTKDVDHDEIERVFIEGKKWSDYINCHRGIICNYVAQDVELLENIVKGIKYMYYHKKEYAIPLKICLTRSMASSILWIKMLSENDRNLVHQLQIDPYEQIGFRNILYMDIMSHAVGGRVQCVKQGIFEHIGAIDVTSMYPYVCAVFEYPCGDMKIVKNYVPDKLGVYYIRIIKQIKPMVIPYRKNTQEPYNWEYDKSFEKWVTSVDLEQISEYKILHGIVWSGKTRSFFQNYMEKLYEERQAAKYKALNLHWKIFMNSLTGSIFQAPLRNFTLIQNKKDFEQTIKKYSDIVQVLSVENLSNEDLIVIFKPIKLPPNSPKISMQKSFCKNAITFKPWILTMFIYAYARRKLREMWINIESNGISKVLYCDTDSLLFTQCDLVHIDETTGLGGWKKEYWNAKACLHESKIYAIGDKVRIKGVSPSSQSIISDTEIDIPIFESFETASEFFLAGKAESTKPGYEHVEALVQGKHVYFMSWYMQKSRTQGIIKKYCIKHLKPH